MIRCYVFLIRCTIGQEMRSCDQVASTKVLTVQYIATESQLSLSETAAAIQAWPPHRQTHSLKVQNVSYGPHPYSTGAPFPPPAQLNLLVPRLPGH